jgi:histidinol-phosphatase (PHP family)
MKWSNFHQHCHYDDGTKTVEEHVWSAIDQGVISMGFSGHCPVPFENNWSIRKSDIELYLSEINEAKHKFGDHLHIYKSLEVDFIPGMIDIYDPLLESLPLDFTVGSVHFVGTYENGVPWEIDGRHQRFLDGLENIYAGDIQYVIKKYYALVRKMVTSACPDIIGHLDKIKMQNRGFWNEGDNWYKEEVLKTLEEIKGAKAIVEVNTRGIYKKLTSEPYPGRWILEQLHQMNIPVHINSDAHHPNEITKEFRQTALLLKSVGFKNLWILYDREWQPTTFDENGLNFS